MRQAAQNYRDNPRFDIEDAIREVGTGEAVTSLLERKGAPGMAERTLIRPPSSHLGAIDDAARAAVIAASPLAGKYDRLIDRESAFEILQARAKAAARDAEQAEKAATRAADEAREFTAARRFSAGDAPAKTRRTSSARSDSVGAAFAKSFARQLGMKSGQAVVRGILGGLFRGR